MKRILVANRGEIACRVIRAAHALGIEAVAVHSEADADAMHVAAADHAVAIGPAKAAESYLKAEAVLAAARDSGADAVHPGYGFLAENERFAEAVGKAGLTWIGPRPTTIADMGDKERARMLAHGAGVPVLPGSARFAEGDLDGLEHWGRTIGFPLLVKASAGGGGIGMRRVDDPAQLAEVVAATQAMAAKAFGDGTIYLEKLVAPARHIEIQIFGFGDGNAVHLFERECSIQRRFQKIVEESPAPGLKPEVRAAMAEAALRLATQERYRGAGTVEFVVGPDQDWYFLEMNTRIQVEHPVTEMLTGVDLVQAQIRLARGDDLADEMAQGRIAASGHAVEARIYAEKPAMNFMPSPGPLTVLRFPEPGADLRIDTGVREGDQVTFHYDPMIAKMVAHGPTRDAALDRLRTALEATTIEGLSTNTAFCARLMDHPAFRAGTIHTGFVAAHLDALK
ncbi:MAG: biotin carboxylase N-terminal domain-containing protein [Alphaproteobacteria bacterium]